MLFSIIYYYLVRIFPSFLFKIQTTPLGPPTRFLMSIPQMWKALMNDLDFVYEAIPQYNSM